MVLLLFLNAKWRKMCHLVVFPQRKTKTDRCTKLFPKFSKQLSSKQMQTNFLYFNMTKLNYYVFLSYANILLSNTNHICQTVHTYRLPFFYFKMVDHYSALQTRFVNPLYLSSIAFLFLKLWIISLFIHSHQYPGP